jgi:hypothetical protein
MVLVDFVPDDELVLVVCAAIAGVAIRAAAATEANSFFIASSFSGMDAPGAGVDSPGRFSLPWRQG